LLSSHEVGIGESPRLGLKRGLFDLFLGKQLVLSLLRIGGDELELFVRILLVRVSDLSSKLFDDKLSHRVDQFRAEDSSISVVGVKGNLHGDSTSYSVGGESWGSLDKKI